MQTSSDQDDWSLLQAYVQTGSEPAFESIVHRYVDQVYSMALRRTGDVHLAQDVTQAVFLVLVRKAGSISAETVLLGWLCKTTRFIAQTVLRSEYRRLEREKSAMEDPAMSVSEPDVNWEQLSPHIDDALASLGETDRNVVLMRFFHKRTVREVAEKIGSGEAAAQKRISRAIDKMRRFFVRRGFPISGGSLVLLLSVQVTEAAPTALARSIVQFSLTPGAGSVSPAVSALTQAALKSMLVSSIVVPALTGIAVVALLVPVVVLLVRTPPAKRQSYDLSRDFSLAANPNGVWTFGWVPSIGAQFTPIRFKQTVVVRGGIPIQSWQLGPGSNPAIYRHGGTSMWYNGQGTFPPGAVWFHAGDNGRPENFGVIRFTVPSGGAGLHRVRVAVEPHFFPQFAGDTDFYVATNGVEVFSEFLPVNRGTTHSNSFHLAVGDTIDFILGRGADGDEYASGLRIQATVE